MPPSTLRTPCTAIGIMNTLRKFASVCPIIMPNSNSTLPQACQNFGPCFLGNRLKGRQHWYELLESYCLFFWGKRGRSPKGYTCAQGHFGSSGRVGLEQALSFLGSILLPCTQTLSYRSRLLVNSHCQELHLHCWATTALKPCL